MPKIQIALSDFPLKVQGLFLISLILIMEFVFFGAQGLLLEKVETESKQLEVARDILDRCTSLQELLCAAQNAVTKYTFTKQEIQYENFESSVRTAENIFASLRDSLKGYSDQSQRLQVVQQDYAHTINLCHQAMSIARQAPPRHELALIPFRLIVEARAACDKLIAQLIAFTESERIALRTDLEGPRQARANLKKLFFVALLVNALIIFWSAYFFLRGIFVKVDVLIQNAHKLAEGQALQPTILGKDELAYLDQVLTHMANTVTREQQKLKLSEERIRAMIETLPVGVIVIRNMSGSYSIEHANRTILDLLDYSVSELAGQPFSFLFAFPGSGIVRSNVGAQSAESKQSNRTDWLTDAKTGIIERVCYGKSGLERCVQITASDINLPAGPRVLVTLIDVSERMEIQQLRQSFVAIVSHELRTPLTSVRGFLTLLQMGAFGELTDKTIHSASRAEANVVRLINLINDLLDLEKVESGTIKLDCSLLAVAALIKQTVDTMQENADEHRVYLKVQCPPESYMFADFNRLLQVLVNLTSNAIKYSPSGGEVCISWRQITSDGGEISITDEGPGIPEVQRMSVFERFYQVGGANQKHGSGLGLAICKAIIEQHGGMIGVDNRGEKGSRFWFRIPGTSGGFEKLPLQNDPTLSNI